MNPHAEEAAVKAGLANVMKTVQQKNEVSQINRGFAAGIKQGREWILIIALVCSFCLFALVMALSAFNTGKASGKVEGVLAEQSRNNLMQQKMIADRMALMEVTLMAEINKLKKEVKKYESSGLREEDSL